MLQVNKYEMEKSDLTNQISSLQSRMVDARMTIADLEEENVSIEYGTFVHVEYRTNEYLVFALGQESAAQAEVGSIVWVFRRLKKPRIRKMSARGYALHSLRPQLFFPQLESYIVSSLNP